MLKSSADKSQKKQFTISMIRISEAFKIIKRETFSVGSEKVDLGKSVGCVLSEDIVADSDLPPFERSQMDGFAVRAEDTRNAPVKLKIIGESVAGKGFDAAVESGEAVRIMTGARLPKGANAVQKVELTSEKAVPPVPPFQPGTGVTDAKSNITILEPVVKGKFIVTKGFEVKQGETIFSKGEIITANMIASLAAFGYFEVKVSRQPSVAILPTGSEIVDVRETPGKDQIRNSNSIMLKALCEKTRCRAELLPIADDNLQALKTVISKAAGLAHPAGSTKSKIRNPKSEILIITGGVSVGKYDFTKAALREVGAEIFFEQVRLKPGKPTVFAKLGDTLIFGLPGNPVSASVTFYLFVRKAILEMQKALDTDLKQGYAILAAQVKAAKERDTYLPAKLETDDRARLIATPLNWHGSSDFIGFARSEALIVVPTNKSFDKGEVVEIAYL